jgi:hypothetical protein
MYNNRAYYNDWEHQIHVAQHRGTPVERAKVKSGTPALVDTVVRPR